MRAHASEPYIEWVHPAGTKPPCRDTDCLFLASVHIPLHFRILNPPLLTSVRFTLAAMIWHHIIVKEWLGKKRLLDLTDLLACPGWSTISRKTHKKWSWKCAVVLHGLKVCCLARSVCPAPAHSTGTFLLSAQSQLLLLPLQAHVTSQQILLTHATYISWPGWPTATSRPISSWLPYSIVLPGQELTQLICFSPFTTKLLSTVHTALRDSISTPTNRQFYTLLWSKLTAAAFTHILI